MKVPIIGLFAIFVLAGCKSDEEKICLDILEGVVIDPSSLRVNDSTIRSSSRNLEGKSADEIYEWVTGEAPSPSNQHTRKLIQLQLEDGDVPLQTFVSVDYTADARVGKIRDEIVCIYSDMGTGQTLYSLSVQGKDFSKDDFFMLFARIGRPDGLDSLQRVRN